MLQIKIELVHPEAKMPLQARAGDAGMDLFSVVELTLQPGERALVATGIKLEMPEGYEAQVRPRSGLALKHGVTVLNSPGTVDAGYRGEVGVILINHGAEPFIVEKGMRVAQMVIQQVPMVELVAVTSVSDSERGEQGFGSSGMK